MNLFATTPKGLELLLVDELRTLGAKDAAEKLAGVTFTGDLALAYRACLWSRLANRILLRLTQVPAATPEELYTGVQSIDWDEHLDPAGTLNVNFTSSHSDITHTLFGAQKVKDAIVDQLREKYDTRPSVAREHADVCINVYLHRNIANISIDLSGESLHKRGYRLEQGAAPLKENLAAAILMRANWKNIAAKGEMLLDPTCGSGTLLIEAAFIAGDIAPGILRDYYGFLGWKKHDALLWHQLLAEAKERRDKNFASIPTIIGHDIDPHAIKMAFANIERAGLHGKIHVEKRELIHCTPKQSVGLLVSNPPYGERLGEFPELPRLYENFGALLKKEFRGWRAAVFTGNPELGKTMGLRACKHYALFNGAIPCQLLLFDVRPEYFVDRSPETQNERRIRYAQKQLTDVDRAAAEMLTNRLKKNLKNIRRWLEQENITHYRIYDADLPEYAVAIDYYDQKISVEEYPAPKTIDKHKAQQRLYQVLAILPEALNIPAKNIFLRERLEQDLNFEDFYAVEENGAAFLINLRDSNIEVGLPLEQRNLRQVIQKNAANKNFLHLFSRAGVMNIDAARGGAKTIKAISDHEFYQAWSQRNMLANKLTGQFIHESIPEWIAKDKNRYDLIFADLPGNTFYLCQENPELVQDILKLLTPNGELYLVTRDSRFKLAPELNEAFAIEDKTLQILPADFASNAKIQQCWLIKQK